MIRRQCVLLVLAIISLLLSGKPAAAYQEDMHYSMTYVICRSVGFTHEEAIVVAAADQGMDDSDGTSPVGPFFKWTGASYVANQWFWHALDRDGAMNAKGIIEQKKILFQVAQDLAYGDNTRERLIMLGVFLHYQQDTWSHRHHYNKGGSGGTLLPQSRENWITYNTPGGHVGKLLGEVYEPDYPPYDPVTAFMCLEDGILYTRTFLKNVLHREPRSFLANYAPADYAAPKITDSGGGSRHQLVADGQAGTAHRYLQDLTHAQVEAFPAYIYASGAGVDKTLDPIEALKVFQKVCDDYKADNQLGGDLLKEILLKGNNAKQDVEFTKDVEYGRMHKHNTLTKDYLEEIMGGWQTVLGFWGENGDDDSPPSTSLQGILGYWHPVPNGPHDSPFLNRQFAATGMNSLIVLPDKSGVQRSKEPNDLDVALLGVDRLGDVWYKAGKDSSFARIAAENWPSFSCMTQVGLKLVGFSRSGMYIHLMPTITKMPSVPWTLVGKAKDDDQVSSVAYMHNGKLLGVIRGKLYTRPLNDGPWTAVATASHRGGGARWGDVTVGCVTVMPDGTILGVSNAAQRPPLARLLTRHSLTAPWKLAPNCDAMGASRPTPGGSDTLIPGLDSLTMMPDGRLLAVRLTTHSTASLIVKGRLPK